MIENKIVYTVGFFLTPIYCVHFLPVETLKRRNNYNNHYSGSNKSNDKSKTKIRSFDRSSKVNFF